MIGRLDCCIGIAVNWLDMVVYWSDNTLGHMMLFKPDGRYHTILLAGLNSPRGLTIDPVTGLVVVFVLKINVLKILLTAWLYS